MCVLEIDIRTLSGALDYFKIRLLQSCKVSMRLCYKYEVVSPVELFHLQFDVAGARLTVAGVDLLYPGYPVHLWHLLVGTLDVHGLPVRLGVYLIIHLAQIRNEEMR